MEHRSSRLALVVVPFAAVVVRVSELEPRQPSPVQVAEVPFRNIHQRGEEEAFRSPSAEKEAVHSPLAGLRSTRLEASCEEVASRMKALPFAVVAVGIVEGEDRSILHRAPESFAAVDIAEVHIQLAPVSFAEKAVVHRSILRRHTPVPSVAVEAVVLRIRRLLAPVLFVVAELAEAAQVP